jgi:hypothetical protein
MAKYKPNDPRYRVKLKSVGANIAPTASTSTYGVKKLNPSDSTQWANLIATWAQFKVNSVRVILIPVSKGDGTMPAGVFAAGLIRESEPDINSLNEVYSIPNSKIVGIAQHRTLVFEYKPSEGDYAFEWESVASSPSDLGMQLAYAVELMLSNNSNAQYQLYKEYDVTFRGINIPA